MFKRLCLVIVLLMLMVGYANASNINETLIAATTLDDDPTLTSASLNVQDYKKVGFWVKYDETEVGNSISLAVTITVSYDGTNYVAGNFYDVAGGSTAQTSETISSDGWYFFWLNADWPYKHVKVVLTATNTDADDIAVVTCYVVGQR